MQIVLIMFGWLFKMTSLTKRGIKAVGEKSPVNSVLFFREDERWLCGVHVFWRERKNILLMILNTPTFQLIGTQYLQLSAHSSILNLVL